MDEEDSKNKDSEGGLDDPSLMYSNEMVNMEVPLEGRISAIGPGEMRKAMANQYRGLIDSLMPPSSEMEGVEYDKGAIRELIAKSDLTPDLQARVWLMATMADTMENEYKTSSYILRAGIVNLCTVRIARGRKGRSESVQMITNTMLPPEPEEKKKKKSFIEKFFGM
jgi:hypothetical protein